MTSDLIPTRAFICRRPVPTQQGLPSSGFLLAALVGLGSAVQGAEFRNLSFEGIRIPAGYVPTAPRPGDKEALLPFWTTYFEPACPNSQFPFIPYLLVDDLCLGSPCLAVWSQAHRKGTYVPLAGRYTLHVQGPQFCQEDVPSATGIRQRATIPPDARSLSFLANVSGMLQIKINGQTVRSVPQETFTRYTRYAVDVSAHAGLEVDLSFSAVPTPQWPSFVGRLPNQTMFELDDLRFGPEPVQFADGPGTMMLSPGTVANSWIVGFTGVLEYSGNPEGPWIPVEGLLSPLELVPRTGPEVLFLRARAWP